MTSLNDQSATVFEISSHPWFFVTIKLIKRNTHPRITLVKLLIARSRD